MQMRCYRCNWSFAVKDEELAFVLEALEESGDTHYAVRCPRCRRTTKLSIEQIRQAIPRAEPEAGEEREEDQGG
jgi:hypothetical protein